MAPVPSEQPEAGPHLPVPHNAGAQPPAAPDSGIMGLLPEMGDNLLQASYALSRYAETCMGMSMHVHACDAWENIFTCTLPSQ